MEARSLCTVQRVRSHWDRVEPQAAEIPLEYYLCGTCLSGRRERRKKLQRARLLEEALLYEAVTDKKWSNDDLSICLLFYLRGIREVTLDMF